MLFFVICPCIKYLPVEDGLQEVVHRKSILWGNNENTAGIFLPPAKLENRDTVLYWKQRRFHRSTKSIAVNELYPL